MANLAYIQICRICNQECRFCSNPPLDKTIPLKKAQSLVDKYINKKYDGVILSGGEPTLYPHLAKLISYATQKNLPIRIITNGQKTANFKYLRSLALSGLKHMNVSIYSNNPDIQSFLTGNKNSLQSIKKTLTNAKRLHMTIDVSTVINKYNSNHLTKIVKWIVKDYSFIKHFVWNNLDPAMNRATENPDTIPSLRDFELELYNAMCFLYSHKRTFRAERVPLCYMVEFAHCSTEARKIIRKEERTIYFLDKKGLKYQRGWSYKKAKCCSVCTLNSICPGLHMMNKYFSSKELYPVFVSKSEIARKAINNHRERNRSYFWKICKEPLRRNSITFYLSSYCNNFCVFCPEHQPKVDKTFFSEVLKYDTPELQALKQEIESASKHGLNQIYFVGRDVLSNPFILDIVSSASKNSFKKIVIKTPGERLKRISLLRNLIKAGVTEFQIPIYGPTKSVHNSVTHSDRSFNDLLYALNNLRNLKPVTILHSIVLKQNFKRFPALVKLISEKYSNMRFHLYAYRPHTHNWRDYQKLMPRYKIIEKHLQKGISLYSKAYPQRSSFFQHFAYSFLDMPFCIIKNIDGGLFRFLMKGLSQEKICSNILEIEKKMDLAYHSKRKKVSACSKCFYGQKCHGPYAAYIKAYGESEFYPLKQK
ncbi:radical SAM protein [Thermoproteota archaeon]